MKPFSTALLRGIIHVSMCKIDEVTKQRKFWHKSEILRKIWKHGSGSRSSMVIWIDTKTRTAHRRIRVYIWVEFGGWMWCGFRDLRFQSLMGKKKRITRMLQLQATVKRFQFDLYVNLEGQHMLTSSWSQKISLLEQIDESNCTKHG